MSSQELEAKINELRNLNDNPRQVRTLLSAEAKTKKKPARKGAKIDISKLF